LHGHEGVGHVVVHFKALGSLAHGDDFHNFALGEVALFGQAGDAQASIGLAVAHLGRDEDERAGALVDGLDGLAAFADDEADWWLIDLEKRNPCCWGWRVRWSAWSARRVRPECCWRVWR